MNLNNPGILYIVATPIGNLQDITFRAVETLKTVQCIAAEDTRHSASLLEHYGIKTPVFALHEHNERERTMLLLTRLQQGDSIALISDAGTPLISDPGYFLVKEARASGIRIVPIPGPCAAITALSASGLPTDTFTFVGFLPAKTKARVDRLSALQDETRTLIFYEAPHRILELLADMKTVLGGERQVVLARELTKKFETIYSASLEKMGEWVKQDANQQRGEMVVMVEGAQSKGLSSDLQKVMELLLAEMPLKKAVNLAAKITGGRKNELYEMALKMKEESRNPIQRI